MAGYPHKKYMAVHLKKKVIDIARTGRSYLPIIIRCRIIFLYTQYVHITIIVSHIIKNLLKGKLPH